MKAPVTPSERDLRTLAGIVSDYRADVPAQGLPVSLLSDLMSQIRCDAISFEGFDSDAAGDVVRRRRSPLTTAPGMSVFAPGALEALLGVRAVQLSQTAPAICAPSSRLRISTQPGNGTAPACIAICTGRRASSMN